MLQFILKKDYVSIARSIISFVVTVGWIFCFCHFGSQTTERFENIGIFVYELNWYRYPIELQKHLQMIILSSQKGCYIEGYCNTQCTRETFKQVNSSNWFYGIALYFYHTFRLWKRLFPISCSWGPAVNYFDWLRKRCSTEMLFISIRRKFNIIINSARI